MVGFLAMVVRSKAQNSVSLCLDLCLDRVFCSVFVIASPRSFLGRVFFHLANGNVSFLRLATTCVCVNAPGVDGRMELGDLGFRRPSGAGFLTRVEPEPFFIHKTCTWVKSRAYPVHLNEMLFFGGQGQVVGKVKDLGC